MSFFAAWLSNADTATLLSVAGFAGVLMLSAGRTLLAVRKSRRLARRDNSHRADGTKAKKKLSPIRALAKSVAFLHAPVAAVSAVYTFVFSKSAFLAAVPAVFSSYGKGLQQVLPLHARNLTEAFQLGSLYQAAVEQVKDSPSQTQPLSQTLLDILRQVIQLTGREDVSLQHLLGVPDEIRLQDDSRSMTGRVLSLFSVVNLVWATAIVGMTANAAPTIVFLSKPIHRHLQALWTGAVAVARKLRFVGMEAAYGLAFYIVIESARYPADTYSLAGTMVAFTGLCGFALSWFYNTYLFADGGGEHFDLWIAITSALLFATSWALAALHQSSFLGCIAVASLLRFLFCVGLRSAYFGTDYDRSVDSLMAGCMLLGLGNAMCRALNIQSAWLTPMQPAVAFLSSTIYLWVLLVAAIRMQWFRPFLVTRPTVVYCANVAALFAAGKMLSIPSMTLVAETYAGLFAFLFFLLALPRGGAAIFSVFFASGALYWVSLYVSRHPQYLTGLLGF